MTEMPNGVEAITIMYRQLFTNRQIPGNHFWPRNVAFAPTHVIFDFSTWSGGLK
jgi:hypothetical protein